MDDDDMLSPQALFLLSFLVVFVVLAALVAAGWV